MAVETVAQAIRPEASFRKQVEMLSGQVVASCFQCEKCSAGCPVTFAMDILPHRLIRAVNLGLRETVLNSETIWVCASCETCSTRCPNGIEIARVMDSLRQLCQAEAVPSRKEVPAFHHAFLASIRRHGRVNEMEMAIDFSLKAGGLRALLGQAMLGIAMFRRGKIRIFASPVRGKKLVRRMFENAEL